MSCLRPNTIRQDQVTKNGRRGYSLPLTLVLLSLSEAAATAATEAGEAKAEAMEAKAEAMEATESAEGLCLRCC
jgi:hypothetical protein